MRVWCAGGTEEHIKLELSKHLETFSPSYHHMKIRNFGGNLVQNTGK